MNIILTGAAGSIGHIVLDYWLKNTDHSFILLTSYHHKGYKDQLTDIRHQNKDYDKRVVEYNHDLNYPIGSELLEKLRLSNIKGVLHLAAMSDVFLSVKDPVPTIKNNINSSITMLELSRELDLNWFLYQGTDEIYGPVEKGKGHKEWATHRPSNPYSASKAACEDIAYCYWRAYNIPVIFVNIMNAYGERQSKFKFPVLIQKSIENNEIIKVHANNKEIGSRFYIDSVAIADALNFITDKGAYQHKVGELDEPVRFNIVGDLCLNNLELAQSISKLMKKPLKYELEDFHSHNPSHDIHYGLDGTKLKKEGWISPTTFDQGMKRVIDWQTKNKNWI